MLKRNRFRLCFAINNITRIILLQVKRNRPRLGFLLIILLASYY
jgi:hypothetical protein